MSKLSDQRFRILGGGDPGSRRPCQHPECGETGHYRAPVSRLRLGDYYWFCLEHVREYNSGWDFFGELSEEEIEQIRRDDTVWQRPSWPLGGDWNRAEAALRARARRARGFAEDGSHGDGAGRTARPAPANGTEAALAALDLQATASFTEVKTRYKKLAKRLHPDANGGDRRAEDRLKVINQAYATLKKAYSA
jgi:DnaJ-domain-containing protein 1